MPARPGVMSCFCLAALPASITAETRDRSGSSHYDVADEFHHVMIPTRDDSGAHSAGAADATAREESATHVLVEPIDGALPG